MGWCERVLDWLFKPRGIDKPENILVDVGGDWSGKRIFLRANSKREAKTMLANRNMVLNVYYDGHSAGMQLMNKKLEGLVTKKAQRNQEARKGKR